MEKLGVLQESLFNSNAITRRCTPVQHQTSLSGMKSPNSLEFKSFFETDCFWSRLMMH
jgi:hypothetical protein